MSAFDFAHPDFTVPTFPSVTVGTCSAAAPVVPMVQALPAQESGTRPTRPLPYQPNATSHTDCAAGRFVVAMSNAGTAAVHLQMMAQQFRADGPWHYDVAPGMSQEEGFAVVTEAGSRYDLTLSGPNGFERQFAGDLHTACGALEVSSTLRPADGRVELTYVNHGSAEVTFTTTATRYRTDGPWTTVVAPGATQTQRFDVAAMGQRWYALTVTARGDAAFVRRFAGHLEDGRAGVTGM